MPNEVQELVVGFFGSPESADGGGVDITFDGQTAVNVNIAGITASTLQTVLEGLANIDVGDVSVTGSNSFFIEFTGIYADMDVPQISLANNSVFKNAATINLNVTQTGAADMYSTPTINSNFIDGTNDVSGTDEIQNLWLNGATTGTFDVTWNGNTTTWTVGSTTIYNVCDAIIGSGYYSISDFGDNWNITFQGAYAATDVPDITISNNTTDGNPQATTNTQGVAAVTGSPATQTLTFSPPPESGSWSLNSTSYNWDTAVGNTSTYPYNTSNTSASSGTLVLTHQSNGSGQSPLSYSNINLQYLASPGQQHIFTVTLADSPDQGTFKLLENSSQVGSEMSYNSSGFDVQSNIGGYGGGYGVTGSNGGPWTCTSSTHINHNWTAAEGGTFLRKNVQVNIRTPTEGSPDPPPAPSGGCGLLRKFNRTVRRPYSGGVRVIRRRINVMCVRYIKYFR